MSKFQLGGGKKAVRVKGLRLKPVSGTHLLHLHSGGKNLITWPH